MDKWSGDKATEKTDLVNIGSTHPVRCVETVVSPFERVVKIDVGTETFEGFSGNLGCSSIKKNCGFS